MSAQETKSVVAMALKAGYVTKAQLDDCMNARRLQTVQGQAPQTLEELLVAKGYLSEDQFNELMGGLTARTGRLFGEIAIKSGLATVDQVKECLKIQLVLKKKRTQPPRLGELLVTKGYLKVHQVRKILEEQNKKIAQCQSCGAAFNVRQFQPGDKISCRNCGAELQILEGDAVANVQNLSAGMTIVGDEMFAPEPSRKTAADMVGEYRIIEKLGADVMGTVYRAEHDKKGVEVALKVMAGRKFADGDYRARFVAQMQKCARVKSPMMRRIVSAGQDGDSVYVAMEYFAGESVRGLLRKEGRIFPKKAVYFIEKAAEALKIVHKAGLVHGDLRPSNIFVDENGQVKILGLGLAPDIGENIAGMLKAGQLAPFHFAPEQVAKGFTVDHRADIYGLGATLYHLLAGRAPFEGQNPQELLVRFQRDYLPSLKSYNPEVPDSYCAVIEKMLKPRAEDRYQDLDEMLRDLKNPDAAYDRLIAGSADVMIGGHEEDEDAVFDQWLPEDMNGAFGRTIAQRAADRAAKKTFPLAKLIVAGVALLVVIILGLWGSSAYQEYRSDAQVKDRWTKLRESIEANPNIPASHLASIVEFRQQFSSHPSAAPYLEEASRKERQLRETLEDQARSLIRKVTEYVETRTLVTPGSPPSCDARFSEARRYVQRQVGADSPSARDLGGTRAWRELDAPALLRRVDQRARAYYDQIHEWVLAELKALDGAASSPEAAQAAERELAGKFQRLAQPLETLKLKAGSDYAELTRQAEDDIRSLRESEQQYRKKFQQAATAGLLDSVSAELDAIVAAFEAALRDLQRSLDAAAALYGDLDWAGTITACDQVDREMTVRVKRLRNDLSQAVETRRRDLSNEDGNELTRRKAEREQRAQEILDPWTRQVQALKEKAESERKGVHQLLQETLSKIPQAQRVVALDLAVPQSITVTRIDTGGLQLESSSGVKGSTTWNLDAPSTFGAKIRPESMAALLQAAYTQAHDPSDQQRLGIGLYLARFGQIEAALRWLSQAKAQWVDVEDLIRQQGGVLNAQHQQRFNQLDEKITQARQSGVVSRDRWREIRDEILTVLQENGARAEWAGKLPQLRAWLDECWRREAGGQAQRGADFFSPLDNREDLGDLKVSPDGDLVFVERALKVTTLKIESPLGSVKRVRFRVRVDEAKAMKWRIALGSDQDVRFTFTPQAGSKHLYPKILFGTGNNKVSVYNEQDLVPLVVGEWATIDLSIMKGRFQLMIRDQEIPIGAGAKGPINSLPTESGAQTKLTLEFASETPLLVDNLQILTEH